MQSLQTEDRLRQLLAELETLRKWDAVLLTETWRELKEEQFVTRDGHLFMAFGGTKGQKGVAIILHRRWTHSMGKFCPVSERVCYVDLSTGPKKLTLISVYMPHGSCPNNEVEQTYAILTQTIKQARRAGRIAVICGDWNAVTGKRLVAEDPGVIGDYGAGARNARGAWMVQWSVCEKMTIINTQFEKDLSRQWTYYKGYATRQLDYASIDQTEFALVEDAEASDDIATGIDHRAVKVVLQLPAIGKVAGKKLVRKQSRSTLNWEPNDARVYQKQLEARMSEDASGDGSLLQKALAEKCTELEQMLADVARECQMCEQSAKLEKEKLSKKAKSLIAERRQVRSRGFVENGRTVKQISKDLQRELRACDRLHKRHKIATILEEFKGLKKIAFVKNNEKKQRLTSVQNEKGEIQYDRQEIVDVFASFYETLYAKRGAGAERSQLRPNTSSNHQILAITGQEVEKQLMSMKNGKAADSVGIVAEMVKVGGKRLQEALADLFNEVLLENAAPPAEWKHTRIKVLLKKGDPQIPGNYRPISILSIFYKLFSRILHQRLKVYLEPQQCVDQAGFRAGFNCDDHLLTLVLLYEKLNEQNLDLWIAVVDFEKAFDSVSHESIWETLHSQNVPTEYIEVLQRLYEGQTGQIVADRSSRSFPLERGTKQGDPLSPALFNAVLEHVMRTIKCKWKAQKFGINVDTEMLNNLRFADDLLLIGSSRAQVRHMLEDLAAEAAKVGLKLHMGKTKILTTRGDRRGCLAQSYVEILGEKVEVLPAAEGILYLGRMVNFSSFHDAEIDNRISRGWAAFGKFKNELCCKHYPLKHRMKLFDATVSATVLYGSGTWTMTKDRESTLRTNMRRMLRKIHGCPRKLQNEEDRESWVEWIVRATHTVENVMQSMKMVGWVEAQIIRKQLLAKRIRNSTDDRWSKRLLSWQPDKGFRRVGRPCTTWVGA